MGTFRTEAKFWRDSGSTALMERSQCAIEYPKRAELCQADTGGGRNEKKLKLAQHCRRESSAIIVVERSGATYPTLKMNAAAKITG